ncbi:rab3 GTPase-activating protein regulatory subunit-like [Dendroctonus ponderosae]|uniref:Rab3-GAP regulatory subunit N-terminal domain-containing protein n=1 Tax=Dendroctonus ponderosae TaxID=77166 RepID=U4TTB4_DENPD|nr:rab3 GTPase-activating protein regulatory subunit [Dendroctonus ponderosae]XP_048525961.1 rab3 GTPase-activating protein regulatory subunit-like [Dendroctonus ponderosae]ERL83997.1 hypothetical protein D910_01313 [Dendroctonus ponderosae]ERL90088.1 hypothetical protein D910_07442 [Dendroctonus ponderosae]KAH1017310.1 hypothetical protein HUJ05_007971 [Dendroctonus ponderosae]
MSCEIRVTATIQDIPSIRRCLFPTDDHRGTESWLQTCHIAASPTGDVLAIANERRLVILSSKWDSTLSRSLFQINFADSIHDYDKVKAALCLPIVGESHSSHVGPDWICTVLGFDSGYVRFYTESGDLLFEEQFHSENITGIKCQSQHNPRPDLSPELHPEELYIHYQSNVCLVSGQQLFENLKNLRSQLARVQAKGSPIEFKGVPLSVRKWGFQDQSSVNDVAVIGLNMTNTFDHLLTASVCGGFEAKYRNTAPNSTLVLAAGSKPFLGYHYALEGVTQPVLSDVAKAVASKLKSALPGWLTGAKSETKEVTIAMHPVENMALRFGLCDLRRTASEIFLSPSKKLAAVSDSLGRVLLIDSYRGVILKNFKGYREAQCAFLQVPDERKSKHRFGNKVATFLLIYSPKKGTLEIFTVQQGTKIVTFSASKYSKLLYITHGLMGFTTTSKSRYVCQYTCVFLDNDGQIREISVPFHFALAEKSSIRARDIHLHKKLRQLIKTDCPSEVDLDKEIFHICTELKTVELRQQTLEMLLNHERISAEVLARCLQHFLDDPAEGDAQSTFRVLCTNAKSVLELYLFAVSTSCEAPENDNNADHNNKLNLEERDLQGLQKLLDLATATQNEDRNTPRVRFSSYKNFPVSSFLWCFDLTSADEIGLKPDTEELELLKSSEVLFRDYISGTRHNLSEFSSALLASRVRIKDLFNLAIHYWVFRSLDISLNLEQDMYNFLQVITALGRMANKEILADVETVGVSGFWGDIRETLANNARSFPALMAAMLCKHVMQRDELQDLEDNMELLTQEDIEWSLLIGKLEDISTLNLVLGFKPQLQRPVLPKLSHEKVDISLKYILQNGKGSVSELTARWLTTCGIGPQQIVLNDKIISHASANPDQNQDISEGMHLEMIQQVNSEAVFKYLNLLKQQFPYSLEVNNLLSNVCWEYALAWRRDIKDLSNLRAALQCLKEVPDKRVRAGLFQLMWNTHLKIVLEASCKLINKVGKLPKERLCQQDTGLSDKEIAEFIEISTDFLDSFLDTLQSEPDLPKPEVKFEPLFENSGPLALIELAVQQKRADYGLLHLHYQLCVVLHMITKFNVKHAKPVNNLFEPSLVGFFFTDLQRQQDVSWNKSDVRTNSSREQFLRKIITSSLETVTLDDDGQVYCKEHMEWMDKCLMLTRIWNLNVDSFRRYQIILLYMSGYDLVAQDLIPAVDEPELLGEDLLKVAGNRLGQFLSSSVNLGENIAALSPMLSRYIDSLNEGSCSPSNLTNIKVLANQAKNCIGESQKELFKLAELLLDACDTLEQIRDADANNA